jgi:hypothetical protein
MKHFYLLKEFARSARRSGLSDDALREAVDRAEAGTIDADLGGGLIKQRIARTGEGRSGGFRTILTYRKGARAVFLHLFSKARQPNIGPAELETYRKLAEAFDGLDDAQMDELVSRRGWRKIEQE